MSRKASVVPVSCTTVGRELARHDPAEQAVGRLAHENSVAACQPHRAAARRCCVRALSVAEPGAGSAAPRWAADVALAQLYAAHWDSLVRLSWLLVRDQHVAEESVQDAFVAMHARWSQLREPESALAYLRARSSTPHARSCATAASSTATWSRRRPRAPRTA